MYSKKRRKRNKKWIAIEYMIIAVVICYGFLKWTHVDLLLLLKAHYFAQFIPSKQIVLGFTLIVFIFITIGLFRLLFNFNQRRRRLKKISLISPSINREDYYIRNLDYRRGNPKENYYKKRFALRLLETFHNCCAKCGNNENGIDIDHFIFSKNEGGSFIMQHKQNYLVNNAIPLCISCNRSKSDKSHLEFFNEYELLSILQKNAIMTNYLNSEEILDDNGELLKINKIA